MPLYGYRCKEHGEFEVWQGMNDEHTAQCPECGKDAVQLLYPSALHNLPSSDQRMGKTREELFQNLGKEGFADRDMWKGDKQFREEHPLNR